MRRLTVKRSKSFVGCLGVMKVYIESADGDTEICATKCKKLGDLKNGAEASFDIGNERAKIYVIADKISSRYCNDCYQLEEGEEDIYLSGKNKLNPATTNAFRFDGNDSDEARAERKKGLKKGTLVIICAIFVGLALGFGVSTGVFELIKAQEQTFTADEMTITLNKSFNRQTAVGYAGVFVSSDVEILMLKEHTSDTSSDLTAEEYAQKLLNYQKLDYESVKNGSLTAFVYSNEANDGNTYEYHLYSFRTDDAYWLVYFAVEEGKAAAYRDDIKEWAGSIVFE